MSIGLVTGSLSAKYCSKVISGLLCNLDRFSFEQTIFSLKMWKIEIKLFQFGMFSLESGIIRSFATFVKCAGNFSFKDDSS